MQSASIATAFSQGPWVPAFSMEHQHFVREAASSQGGPSIRRRYNRAGAGFRACEWPFHAPRERLQREWQQQVLALSTRGGKLESYRRGRLVTAAFWQHSAGPRGSIPAWHFPVPRGSIPHQPLGYLRSQACGLTPFWRVSPSVPATGDPVSPSLSVTLSVLSVLAILWLLLLQNRGI